MTKSLRIHWVAVAAVSLAIAGCQSGDKTDKVADGIPSAKAEGKRLRIAVIPKGSTHVFWKAVHAGADDAAKELGNVDVIWKGPLKEDDRESQVKTVEDFVTNKVDGIVLAPLDKTALKGPVSEATKSDIPVLIIDSALDGGDTVSFVATDNEKGGEMAGDAMVKLLGGKGKVVMLRYQENSASTEARELGFLTAIKKASGITVVSENQHAGATVESAQRASENLLQGLNKGAGMGVDGIFTPNESSTFGMLRVLQDGGNAGKVKFVGFDSSPKLLEGLKAGQINGLVIQNPRKMGYLGVKTIVEHVKGGKVEARIDTGAALITKENMDTPENQKLLTPPAN